MMLPSPSSLTEVRVWHGTIAQVSYAPFKTNMRPTHSPLYSKLPLEWSLELKAAFQVSSKETIKPRELRVKGYKIIKLSLCNKISSMKLLEAVTYNLRSL